MAALDAATQPRGVRRASDSTTLSGFAFFQVVEDREAVRKRIRNSKFHRRIHARGLNAGIARLMNSSNSGTVNVTSPCAGL